MKDREKGRGGELIWEKKMFEEENETPIRFLWQEQHLAGKGAVLVRTKGEVQAT